MPVKVIGDGRARISSGTLVKSMCADLSKITRKRTSNSVCMEVFY
jgi:hypothetical protein